MLKTYKATAKKLSKGLQVEASSRGFKILMDEPEELGGTDAGMTPVELLLSALAGCKTIVASAFAAAQDITFEEFRIDLEGDLDPDGFLGLADVRNGFQEIRFVMHFKSDEPREKLKDFANFIQDTCPVGDNLVNGVDLVFDGIEVERISKGSKVCSTC